MNVRLRQLNCMHMQSNYTINRFIKRVKKLLIYVGYVYSRIALI